MLMNSNGLNLIQKTWLFNINIAMKGMMTGLKYLLQVLKQNLNYFGIMVQQQQSKILMTIHLLTIYTINL